jgi:hypothetical protein
MIQILKKRISYIKKYDFSVLPFTLKDKNSFLIAPSVTSSFQGDMEPSLNML